MDVTSLSCVSRRAAYSLDIVTELEPFIGKTIAGRYRVTDMIGMGGMGAVYAAVQEPLGRSVALKVLKPGFARDDVAVARFKKEAAIVAELSHPNIVTLHDYGETEDGTLYIVMERLRGATLSSLLRARGAMTWQRTLPIIQDIVRALSIAHAHGIIHRDLKLDNVMLVQADGGPEIVKVLDFGVAKTLKSVDTNAALTQTDSSPGTPGYMSPELARGISNDPRSDFYALGVVWFELIVGRRPFTDKNAMDVFLHQMTRPPPSIRKEAPKLDVPESVDALVRLLLDKDPTKRPANTDALLDAMFALEDQLQTDPRRRRSTSSETSSRVSSTDVPTLPTGAGLFLPTQAGGAPPFTDADAVRPTEDGRYEQINASTNTVTITDPIVPPDFDAANGAAATIVDAAAMTPATPPVVQLARAQPRSRAPIAAAVVLFAGVVVLLVTFSQQGTETPRDVDTGIDPGARGPLAFQVEMLAANNAEDDDVVTSRGAPGLVPGGRAVTQAMEKPPPPESAPSTEVPTAVAPVEVAPVEAVNASGVAVAMPASTHVSADELRARLSSANNQIRERFLLPDDVADYRKLTNDISKALGANRVDDAEAGVRELEAALSSLRITEQFIRKKIARVEANFPKGWPRNEAQRADLAKLRSDVAERFGANDLPGANYALNKLWLFSLKARQTNE